MVDKDTQGTTAADANIHAMLGTTMVNGVPVMQTPGEGILAMSKILGSAPLPVRIHFAQDYATPDHFLQPWNGFNWTSFDTYAHIWHDMFPAWSTIKAAYFNTKKVLNCECQ